MPLLYNQKCTYLRAKSFTHQSKRQSLQAKIKRFFKALSHKCIHIYKHFCIGKTYHFKKPHDLQWLTFWLQCKNICSQTQSWLYDHCYYTAVCEVSPVFVVVQGDVGDLVALDPLQEVGHRLLLVTVNVIWAAEFHLLWKYQRPFKGCVYRATRNTKRPFKGRVCRATCNTKSSPNITKQIPVHSSANPLKPWQEVLTWAV